MARKVKWLMSIIVGLVLLWSVLWYGASVATGKVIDRVEQQSVRMGRDVSCNERTVSGYPFHLEVSCGQAVLDAQDRGIEADIDSVRSVALLYKPGHVIAEADGPLTVKLSPAAGLSGELVGRWKSARSSVSAGLSGLKRASLVAEEIDVIANALSGPANLDGPDGLDGLGSLGGLEQMTVQGAQLHVRPNPDSQTDFDVALTLSDILTTRSGKALPEMDLGLLATAKNVGEALGFDPDLLLANWLNSGGALDLEKLSFNSLGFAANASGPVTISQDGLVSGQVKLEITGMDKLPDLVAAIAPRFRQNAEQIAATFSGLAGNNPDGKVIIALTLRNGIVSAGILPIGRIPNLF
ncbi:DUF2125 domain-containing protein [Pararhizobium sp. IMCC21322]|uniref:DUF2125 domain-containing protein n=1 Tax=Pararhizobium sp. IMCC21322 TaxID=3067903 RepID=UPI0027413346|nr:DUF2125 domain-containing protein [Pararhizobium sp. IMCC21322]